jgi:hydroxymethylpyrimidine/phosphomethylpyrimidine kinase
VQNSLGVTGVHTLPPETVAAQIEAVATDIGLDAVKTGMLATTPIIRAIAEACDRTGIGSDGRTPLVVDPVAASMHGDPLLADNALDAYRTLLFPRATVITPNLDEVRLLTGIDVRDRAGQYEAAKVLYAFGPRHVLVKGGHLADDRDVCVDLHYDGHTFTELPGPRFTTGNTHGGGDTMASALASGLARGLPVDRAVAQAKRFVVEAVRHSYDLGAGHCCCHRRAADIVHLQSERGAHNFLILRQPVRVHRGRYPRFGLLVLHECPVSGCDVPVHQLEEPLLVLLDGRENV